MEFRDYITSETSALVDRLVAAAEAAAQQAKLEADTTIAQLRAQVEEFRTELEGATSRADSLAAKVDAETSRAELLAARVDAETLRADSLASRLDTETAQVATVAAQLDVETRRATTLAAQLEAESARAAALAAEIEASAGAIRKADGERLKAESALKSMTVELQTVREAFDVACAEAAQSSETLKVEAAEKAGIQQAHDAVVRGLQSRIDAAAAETNTVRAALAEAEAAAREAATALQAQVHGLRDQLAQQAEMVRAAETQVQSLTAQLERQAEIAHAADAKVQSLTAQLEQQTETVRTADARVEAAEAAAARMREEADEANAITDATSTALTAMRDHVKQVMALWNGAASSLKDLGAANTTHDVFKLLVQQLATQFERVAIFKVKEKHLVGDLAAGLDASVDVKKIVIPMGMGSLITKAAAGAGVEHATAEQMTESRPPFGGNPASAFAAPLVFEGEVLAVAYADSDTAFSDAHAPYASVLIRHANAVLAGLAEELRIARQLHDYARTLLRDAEMLFDADVKAGVPEQERVKRLGGSIQFARDLYAQRAALEPMPPADSLEEEIAEIVRAEAPTPFAAALAGLVRDRQAQTA